MHRIKIPLQDFAVKMQGRGGAYLWDTMVYDTGLYTVDDDG